MSIKAIGSCLVVLCLFNSLPSLAQMEDTSRVMDQRMATIAGNAALNCGRVRIGENAPQALKCAREAIGGGEPFFVRFDYSGTDSLLSDGLAGDSQGNVFLILFDSLGWGGEGVLDGRHDIIEKCPKPVRIRILPQLNKQFVGVTCKRRKRNSDDPHEQ